MIDRNTETNDHPDASGGLDRYESLVLDIDAAIAAGRSPDLDAASLRGLTSDELRRLEQTHQFLDRLYSSSVFDPDRISASSTGTLHLEEMVLPGNDSPQNSLSGEPNVSHSAIQDARIGRFEIMREIGRGAHGVVFLARDPMLNRQVALKVPQPEVLVTIPMRRRFLTEGRAAALLTHPNIVTIFEAGEIGPICYLAQAYVNGMTLAEWLTSHTRGVSPLVAAAIVAQLADGVEHAHERGILHRDLKPGNVLLDMEAVSKDRDGHSPDASRHRLPFVPKVSDFGIAKSLASDTNETAAGTILGTPAYMSPEQAMGHNETVGPASDVYSLGSILYELLTGRPAFRGDTFVDTVRQVTMVDPTPPSRLREDIPRDLEAICLKCLEKIPARRYPSAFELSADLRRFLSDEPTRARPITPQERIVRWCRRNRAVSISLAAIALLLLVVVAVSVSAYLRERGLSETLAQSLEQESLRHREADDARKQAQVKETEALRNLYVADMGQVTHAVARGDTRTALSLLEKHRPEPGQPDFRNGGWIFNWDRCHSAATEIDAHAGPVTGMAFSGDGKLLVTTAEDGLVQVWSAESGESVAPPIRRATIILDAAISQNRDRIAFLDSEGTLELCEVQTGQSLAKTHVVGGPRYCRFSQRDEFLIIATQVDVRLFDVPTLHEKDRLDGGDNWVGPIACSGDLLAAGVGFGNVVIWNLADRKQVFRTGLGPNWIWSVALSADGRFLAACDTAKRLRVWEISSGRLLVNRTEESSVTGLGFSIATTGEMLLFGCNDSTVRLWHPETGNLLKTWAATADQNRVFCVAPQIARFAVGTLEGTVMIWSDEADHRRRFAGHHGNAWSVAYSPDGTQIASCGDDGFVRLWSLSTGTEITRWKTHDNTVNNVTFSPDGGLLAAAGDRGLIQLWDIATHRDVSNWDAECGPIQSIAFAPNGKVLVTCGDDSKVRLWNVSDRTVRSVLEGHLSKVHCVAFSPDGGVLATGSWDTTVRLWEVPSGRFIAKVGAHAGGVRSLSWSPDGRSLASVAADGAVGIWDVQSGNLLHRLFGHSQKVDSIAFVPHYGLLISGGGNDGIIRVWESSSGLELASHLTTCRAIRSIAVAPDSSSFATANSDGAVCLWRGIEMREFKRPVERLDYLRQKGLDHFSRDDFREAHRYFEQAIDEARRTFGIEHPRTKRCILEAACLANTLTGHPESAAVKQIREIRTHFDKEFPPSHLWRLQAEEAADACLSEADNMLDTTRFILNLRTIDQFSVEWDSHIRRAAVRRDWEGVYRSLKRLRFWNNETSFFLLPVAAIAARNQQLYVQECTSALDLFGQTQLPQFAESVAWACTFTAGLDPKESVQLRLAKLAYEMDSGNAAAQRTYGAVLYRSGEYAAAIKQLETAANHDNFVGMTARLFLSMSLAQTGKVERAKSLLDSIQQSIANQNERPSNNRAWHETVILNVLIEEASALLHTLQTG